MNKKRITVAFGDGIGPEIMEATLKILEAAKVPIVYDIIQVGQKMFDAGFASGIDPKAWDIIKENKLFLKAPITTPQGGGFRSLNVTTRKNLHLFANVRPIKAYAPYVRSFHPDMDMVIVRENEEDLYAGIEYQLTSEMVESIKLISHKGSESIIRYAFEYARVNGRKKVTCMTKDNIMKLADGLFHNIFNEVAKEYPTIENDHKIIDIGAALIADKPEMFDVIVTLNLYGDIISDIAAQVAGSVGLMGSSNIGSEYAMFEAIHGSAPDIAGKGIANPSGLLNGAILMLRHLGLFSHAVAIENAWLRTLEDGIHTGDIYKENLSKKRVNTIEFANAVIERLGIEPRQFAKSIVPDGVNEAITTKLNDSIEKLREIVGFDVYFDHQANSAQLCASILAICPKSLQLKIVSNRGHNCYSQSETKSVEGRHWRCRFVKESKEVLTNQDIVGLLQALVYANLYFVKYKTLYNFDGKRAYSLAPGE